MKSNHKNSVHLVGSYAESELMSKTTNTTTLPLARQEAVSPILRRRNIIMVPSFKTVIRLYLSGLVSLYDIYYPTISADLRINVYK